MKYILKILISLTIVLSLFACCCENHYQEYFDIVNNSTKPIYEGVSFSYPDTSLTNVNVPANKVYPGGRTGDLTAFFLRNPTIQIFIFDADVIENTPWDTVVKYNMYLKRYQFTEAELKKMGWEIIYDGK